MLCVTPLSEPRIRGDEKYGIELITKAFGEKIWNNSEVARFLLAIRRSQLTPTIVPQIVTINGQPGIINLVNEKLHSVFSFDITNEQIQSIFAVVNPEKLKGIKQGCDRISYW